MAPEPESAALLRQAAAALSSGNADQLRHRYSPGYGSTPGPSLLPGMKPRAKPSAQVAAPPGKLGKAAEALKAYLDGPPPADSARDELFAIVGDALKMSADQMVALVPYMAQGIASQPAPKRKKPPAMSSDVVRETLTALGAALQTARPGCQLIPSPMTRHPTSNHPTSSHPTSSHPTSSHPRERFRRARLPPRRLLRSRRNSRPRLQPRRLQDAEPSGDADAAGRQGQLSGRGLPSDRGDSADRRS